MSASRADSRQARPGPVGYDMREVYREHAPQVSRWAARLGGPGTDVDDVVQEVFVRVFKNLPHFRGEAALSTWLFQVTANEIRGRRRRERFRRWFGRNAEQIAAERASPALGAYEVLERRQDVAQLYRALDGLKDKYREVLVLFELEGRSGEEIAALMGVRVATVWVWLHRARSQLLVQLSEREEGP